MPTAAVDNGHMSCSAGQVKKVAIALFGLQKLQPVTVDDLCSAEGGRKTYVKEVNPP